jgi:molecular chaperone DnaK (HSP70)
MPAGMARVEVNFQIDADGILSVTARELRTGVEQTIEVRPSYGLTDEQVEQMLLDSFEHADADHAARLRVDVRNEAETVIRATEKTLRSPEFSAIAREELAPGEADAIVSALEGLKAVANGDDAESIQQRTQALNDATRHLAEAVMNRSVQAALAGKTIDKL